VSHFAPRKWIGYNSPLIAPDRTDKSTSVSTGGSNLSIASSGNSPSVGFVGSDRGAVAGKFECEVCLDGVWARRWLSSVEIFNRCCTYLKSVQVVFGPKANHPAFVTPLEKLQPNDQSRELMVLLRSLAVDEFDRKWNEWNQEWQEYVCGWAAPEDAIAFGIVVCAGKFARQAGIIRWDAHTPIIAVADYLEVISNQRYLTSN